MRAAGGICSPARPRGSRCRRAARDGRPPRRERRERGDAGEDLRACRRGARGRARHSSSVSRPGLSRIGLEMPSLPMSCSSPARRRSRSRRRRTRVARRSPRRSAATPLEWRAVNGDLASMTCAKASAMWSSRSSSAGERRGRRARAPHGARRGRLDASRARTRGRRRDREQRVGQRRVEPAAAARARHRRARPRCRRSREEHLDGLREAAMRPSSGISSPAQAVRAGRGRPSARRARGSPRRPPSGSPSMRDDLGAALAARARSSRGPAVARGRRRRQRRPRAPQRRLAGRDVARGEARAPRTVASSRRVLTAA